MTNFDPDDYFLAIQTEPTFDALLKLVTENITGELLSHLETLIVDLRDVVRQIQHNLEYSNNKNTEYAAANWLLEGSLSKIIHHTRFPTYIVHGSDEISARIEWCQTSLKPGWNCAPFIGENCSIFIIPNDEDNLLFKMRWQ